MEEILRFAQVARKKLSVDDLFSYQYFVLPFCDRCVTVSCRAYGGLVLVICSLACDGSPEVSLLL